MSTVPRVCPSGNSVRIVQRVPMSAEEAPITVADAVAYLTERGIPTDRTTIHAKGLNGLIVDAANRQGEVDRFGRQGEERREAATILDRLREQNSLLEKRNRVLLGEIAAMVFNARRSNVSEDEPRRPMPPPNRSPTRAGRDRRSPARRP